MGEIADDHYDRIMDGSWDERDYEDTHSFTTRRRQCRFCKSTGVRWFRDRAGWRLYNTADDELHNCLTGAAPSAEGFGDV